jgi:hypothetical protein
MISASRAARLGEFSPIQMFLSLGNLIKFTRVAQILGNFSAKKVTLLNMSKYGLGNILGDFFTKASGHPVGMVPAAPTFLACQA